MLQVLSRPCPVVMHVLVMVTLNTDVFTQGAGLHGNPMSNMNSQQLMQMQLHGIDMQRMNMVLSGQHLLQSQCI